MPSLSKMLVIACTLLIAPIAAAQQGPLSMRFNGEVFDLIERGAASADALWAFKEGERKILFVCWENPGTSFANEMETVQRAVKTSWQASSKLEFLGWGKCVDSSPGIRILITDDAANGPRVQDFGKKLNTRRNGLVLNFTFRNWSPACQEGPRDVWIARIAVHEFGHAIGFRHEQDRDDTVGEQCRALRTGPNPSLILTKYDPKSIMNYCACEANSNLSDFDKLAVQTLYGGP